VAGAFAAPRLAPVAALLALVILALGQFAYTSLHREAQTARESSHDSPSRESANATPGPAPRNDAPTVAGKAKETDERGVVNPPEKRAVVAADRNTPPNAPRVNKRRRHAEGALQNIAVTTEPERKSPRIEPPLKKDDAVTTASAAPASDRARVAPLDAGRHVEQAQLLLRSFRNARLSDDNLAYERERSKKLLYRNMFLRREAASKGNPRMEGLLDRLEPILVDIANLPDKPAKEEVASIRERVRKKNLVVSLQTAAPRQKDF
ncbi:MAG: hypothetical protein H7Z38_17930, partial [Rubrivivax sp.]|nr:hypothetical protein [Pyrinomonadaceae bacterium]